MADHGEFWDQLWLPVFPLASDDYLRGVYRMARGDALTKRHIQANPHALANLLIVDVDQPDAALRALSTIGSHPMPNAIVENPRNGHAHAVWALTEPVTKTERAHLKPLVYAAAVTEGLRAAVGGDTGYSGLMTKNPIHEHWTTHWLRDDLYSLRQLEHELGPNMPGPQWRGKGHKRGETAGLARNCALFEDARWWAYRELRHWFGNPQGLSAAIHNGITLQNLEFPDPLPTQEANGIARSITRWITTRSRMWKDGPVVYDATFSLIQSHRGRRARPTRREKSQTIRNAFANIQKEQQQ